MGGLTSGGESRLLKRKKKVLKQKRRLRRILVISLKKKAKGVEKIKKGSKKKTEGLGDSGKTPRMQMGSLETNRGFK